MLRKFRRTVNQLIRRDLLSLICEACLMCEEGFFTEWKLGNTPKEKPRNPAFGGVFFFLIFSRCHKSCHIGLSKPAVQKESQWLPASVIDGSGSAGAPALPRAHQYFGDELAIKSPARGGASMSLADSLALAILFYLLSARLC